MKLCLACGQSFDAPEWRCPACGNAPEWRNGFLAFSPEVAEAEAFRAEFFAHLIALEGGSFWFHSRNRLIAWALRTYFPDARDLFEVGCGTGFVLSEIRRVFPALSIAGSDLYTEGLGFAAMRLPGVPLYQMDATRIPFADAFDVVCSFDVLEHIDEDEAVLAGMCRAVRPRGGLLLTVPQHAFLWSGVDDYSLHKRRYARQELVAKVRRAGFDVIRTTSFVSLLLPLLLLSRYLRRGAEIDPHAEFRLSRPTSAVLGGVMTLERTLIAAGLSFPVGGSLLLVGRRGTAVDPHGPSGRRARQG
jgi:SAM-dependent methyltransferase